MNVDLIKKVATEKEAGMEVMSENPCVKAISRGGGAI